MKKRISLYAALAVIIVVFSAFLLSSCGCEHEYVSTVVAPTCTEDGFTVYKCAKCGDTYTDNVVPALGHDHVATVVAPTCTEKGYTTHVCSRCGDTFTDNETDALGHDHVATVVAPTCTEKGYTAHVCSRCGDTFTDNETDELGHDHVATVTAPTCTEKGYTTHVCSRCGDTFTDNETDALGHDHVATVTAPTCTEKGFTTHVCSRCGDTFTDSETDELGHDHVATVTAPMCTEKGYTTHVCSRCGDTYVDTETDALGHDYQKTIVLEATSLNAGTYQYKCSRCGDAYIENYTLSPMTSAEIYAIASKSVCEILTYDKDFKALALGSGFVISEDGQIVTNFHVINEAYAIKVAINGKTYNVQNVLACDEDIDLAVLKINATGLTPVKMLKETPVGGWNVYAFGSPEGLTASMTKGIISSPSRIMDGVECIQHDASISSGSSGGPLFNEYGEVLGVNTFEIADANNICFAVSIKELDKLDYSSPMNMEQFYEKHGPYYEVFIYDRMGTASEPNDSIATATSWMPTFVTDNGHIHGSNGGTTRGSINGSADYDYYQVVIGAGEMLTALMIPEYAIDATGISLCLVDANNNVIAIGGLLTIDDMASVMLLYTNESSSSVTLYVALAYYSSYTYKNTVGNYDLFLYVK